MASGVYEIRLRDVSVPKAHKHALRLKASESGMHSCDICKKDMRAGDYKYKCGDCDFDLCLPCFYKMTGTDPAVDIDGTMKLRAIVEDPEKRKKLVQALKQTKDKLAAETPSSPRVKAADKV